MPDLVCKIDWDNDGSFLHANADVSPDLLEATVVRGKSNLARGIVEGTLSLTLDNTAGTYSRDWASSPVGSQAQPHREVTLDIHVPTQAPKYSIYHLFRGFVKHIQLRHEWGRKECHIEAVDAIELMRLQRFNSPMYEAQSVSTLIGNILDLVRPIKAKPGIWFTFDQDNLGFDIAPLFGWNWTFIKRYIDDIPETIAYAWWQGGTLLDAFEQLIHASGASYYIDGEGQMHVESRYHLLGGAHVTSQQTLEAEIEDVGDYEISAEDVRNYVEASYSKFTAGAEEQLWQMEGVPVAIQPAEKLTYLIEFTNPAQSIVDPVANTHYTVSQYWDGTGADRSAYLSVALSEYGRGGLLELTNTYAAPIYIQTFMLKGNPLSQDSAAKVEVYNDWSVQQYYERRASPISNPLVQSRARAESVAIQTLLRNDVPKPSPMVKQRNDYANQLNRLEGDRVTLVIDGLVTSKDFNVAQIQHHILPTPDSIDLETTFWLEQAPDLIWFTFDDDNLGFDRAVMAY